MTLEQLDALEAWIEAIISDKNSDHIQDAVYRMKMRERFERLILVKDPDQ